MFSACFFGGGEGVRSLWSKVCVSIPCDCGSSSFCLFGEFIERRFLQTMIPPDWYDAIGDD